MESLNDVANFKHMKEALSIIEFTEEEQNALFAIIASVIHLGTIGFLDPEIEHGEVKLENGRPVNVVSKVRKIKTRIYITNMNIERVAKRSIRP